MKRPPRLVARTLAVTFLTVAVVLSPARGAAEALAELRRYAGTQFDPASVHAAVAALSGAPLHAAPAVQELIGQEAV